MRLFSGHSLVRAHEPRELKLLLRTHGAPATDYYVGNQKIIWRLPPQKDDQLVLVVLPGESIDVWSRAWQESADEILAVDLEGKVLRVLKSRVASEDLPEQTTKPAKPRAVRTTRSKKKETA